MKSLKSFLFILLLSVYIFCFSVSVCAAEEIIDFHKWNSIEATALITDESIPSNSSLKSAVVKMTEDEDSNRITLLFMLKFGTFTDISKAEIIIRINGGEKIIIHTDEPHEYNEDKYFASAVVHNDGQSGILHVQTVLGIKDGLPEKKILTLQFRDCDGILSNRYEVDLSGNAENSSQSTKKQTATKTNKTNKSYKTKTDKTDKDQNSADDLSASENTLTLRHTENNKDVTVSTSKVVGGITGIIVLVLSAGYGLSHLINSKQQKRGEG